MSFAFDSFWFLICHYICGNAEALWNLQKCVEEQERLIVLEQAARQKVAELLAVRDSEKSQGSILKAIMQAKESNSISGIYGRMGDLGAIDGK